MDKFGKIAKQDDYAVKWCWCWL